MQTHLREKFILNKTCLTFFQAPFDHRILSAPPSYLVAYQEWPAGIPCSAALEVGENDFLGGESENLSEDNEEMSGESGDDVEPEEYQVHKIAL